MRIEQVLKRFSAGYDTHQIAEWYGCHESIVYNLLSKRKGILREAASVEGHEKTHDQPRISVFRRGEAIT